MKDLTPIAGAAGRMDQETRAWIARRKEILDHMPPALQAVYHRLVEMVASLTVHALRGVWELGKTVAEIEDGALEMYGDDPVERLSLALDQDRSVLRSPLQFYREFPEDRLQRLLQLRLKESGRPLTWSHVKVVLGRERKVQDRLLAACARMDMKPERLAEEVRRLEGRERHAGGRPIKIPSRLDGKLADLRNVLAQVVRRDSAIWRHAQHGILPAVEAVPADRIGPDTLAGLDEGLAVARQAAIVIQDLVEKLEQARELAAKRLQVQAQAQAEEDRDTRSHDTKGGVAERIVTNR